MALISKRALRGVIMGVAGGRYASGPYTPVDPHHLDHWRYVYRVSCTEQRTHLRRPITILGLFTHPSVARLQCVCVH